MAKGGYAYAAIAQVVMSTTTLIKIVAEEDNG
jgi:hypothetical protein